ncbi:MAG: SRPBCC family protein [Chloroflexota bacterium]
MSHVRTQLHLNAPPRSVWALYTDSARIAEWYPYALVASGTERPFCREGAVYTVQMSRWIRPELQVVTVEPFSLHQIRFFVPLVRLYGTLTVQLEEAGVGTTLCVDLDFTFHPLWLTGFLEAQFGGMVRNRAFRPFALLKAAVENPSRLARPRRDAGPCNGDLTPVFDAPLRLPAY